LGAEKSLASGRALRSLGSWVAKVAGKSTGTAGSGKSTSTAGAGWSAIALGSAEALGSTWSWWPSQSLRSDVGLPLGIDVRRYLRFQAHRAAVRRALARSLPASALRSLQSHWSACGLGPLGRLPRLAGQRRRAPQGRAWLTAMHRRRLGHAPRRHEHGGSSDEDCTTGQVGHYIRSLALSYGRVTRFAPLAHSLQPPGESVSAKGSKLPCL
jgi:hypothetical protein